MGHWGWRPLICAFVISVWVTGCAEPHAPLPTSDPGLAAIDGLTTVPLPQGPPSATAPGLPQRISPATPARTRAAAPAAGLDVPPPTCYETYEGGIACLGLVHNNDTQAYHALRLRLDLLDAGGASLAAQQIAPAYLTLSPGQATPYRAMFPPDPGRHLPNAYGGVQVVLSDATPGAAAPALARLSVQDTTLTRQPSQVTVRGQMVNDGDAATPDLRLTVTVRDDATGQVAGFRTLIVPGLAALDRRAFAVALRPHFDSPSLGYSVYIEPQAPATR